MNQVIRIKRAKGVYCFAIPIKVKYGNNQEFKLNNGQEIILPLSEKRAVLTVELYGNSFQFHRVTSRKVIFPEFQKSEMMDCVISVKPNWIGTLSLGLLQATATITISIKY